MIECPNCDEEFDEEDLTYECPFCEYEDGEGFYYCCNCEYTFTEEGDSWICPECDNEGITEEVERKVIIHEVFFDDYDEDDCEELIPDVNQGWVGEHYG